MEVDQVSRSPNAGAGQAAPARSPAGQPLPAWSSALVVVAHPDDETFGLGSVIDGLSKAGAAVHVLCFTHGEASTLNETNADLHQTRVAELRAASAELGVASVTLLGYPDAALTTIPRHELAGRVTRSTVQYRADGLLVFDDTGITGHPDHQAATLAAVQSAAATGVPVLAWTLPAAVAEELRRETGQPFAGRGPDDIDLGILVDRGTQRRAALMHATQISPGAPLWRRLDLLGDREHLRWLVPPGRHRPAGDKPGSPHGNSAVRLA